MEFVIALFESLGLYSDANGLGEHLRGLDLSCTGFTRTSLYNQVFIWLFVINTVVVVNYYYLFFNRRPWNKWWVWLVNVLVAALIVAYIAYAMPHNDLETNNICQQLSVTDNDCVGFATAAAIYSVIWSFIVSLIIKWKSGVNKKVPF
ncbi:hypothetical protein SAMN04488128_1011551 [Chitinophaga eiseniae]|uniref:Uncharacterized protein n=1 Tax=Chitinophaga eiseniae TaxID=634771 RepID=A0A1T4NE64_9BACT|nr:hypothetical protein [Chitinophaga eiseniae]SJZ77562.1 hypothetical protein SAMN04488128_1011551 [Chitinophaga eiseniae]